MHIRMYMRKKMKPHLSDKLCFLIMLLIIIQLLGVADAAKITRYFNETNGHPEVVKDASNNQFIRQVAQELMLLLTNNAYIVYSILSATKQNYLEFSMGFELEILEALAKCSVPPKPPLFPHGSCVPDSQHPQIKKCLLVGILRYTDVYQLDNNRTTCGSQVPPYVYN